VTAEVGDARRLTQADASVDAVLSVNWQRSALADASAHLMALATAP
jgi:hypothetical protein